MRVNDQINLVVDVELADGSQGYVHSTPVSREVFERNYLVISKTFTRIYGEALTHVTGPRVAYYVMRDVATEMGRWDGADGVERGFVAEMHRLTNLAYPTDAGWAWKPYADALRDKQIDLESASDLDNALIFFTLVSVMHKRPVRVGTLEAMGALWGTQITRSGLTEWIASLPTSSATAPSGATVESSVPS